MRKIVDFVKKHKKISILFLIFSFLLLFCIYDRSYIYPPIFFFDTNPVMIKLFKNKDNVNKSDKYGITPLMKAVSMRNKKSVKLLLEKGADPNKAYNKSNNILSNNNSLSAYILIVSEEELTSSGINQKNIGIKYKILKWIKKNTGIKFPFPLLEAENPVKIALWMNEYNILEILLKKGAVVPKLSDINNYERGNTEKIINLVIKYGNNKKDNNLYKTFIYGNINIVKILLNNGTTPNILGEDTTLKKKIPLKEVILKNDTERVRLLLQYGADIHLKDENGGESAFEYVQNNRNEIKKEIVEMIEKKNITH